MILELEMKRKAVAAIFRIMYSNTQLYNKQHCNLQQYQLSKLTNGRVTAMTAIGQDKKRLEYSKASTIEEQWWEDNRTWKKIKEV